ncbi:MerR family transcriptional regulator [Natronogracilivirga saccharolytica]|uniref:MerR family transcriptional regulator n=1 Tax=Natronogracilivirga saccharolytica TaxID=2812953 RepID=A0A8J7UWG2_9BACT|nr:MerR family transcriptional regulator [Natronogracilivirga saccharolytica]MBP3192204.1 MerR family transcriptional regulator [Natronogracilivirga saccharolytica]
MKKLYYTIGETSRMTGVEPHVLRYWESLFNELSPSKNRAGKRVYKEDDIQLILTLKELIQQKKFSTAGAQKVLRDQKKQRSPEDKEDYGSLPVELTQDLSRVRVFLADLLKKI